MIMNSIFILLCMMFCHIIDDFYLQGILANMKQKSWWGDNVSESIYKNDYKVALLVHGFSWAFMIMLPLIIYTHFQFTPLFFIMFSANWIIHVVVDHAKANLKYINLCEDQYCHFTQIFLTWATAMYL